MPPLLAWVFSTRLLRYITYGLLLAEAALFTFKRNEYGYYGSPVLLYAAGVLACVGAYLLTRHQPWLPPASAPAPAWVAGARLVAVLVASGVGGWYCYQLLLEVFSNYFVRIENSDIIPALSIYTRRLLAGEEVYTPFTEELGYLALPTYLPATWMPYLLPEWLQVDYRWMSAALLLAGIGGYQALLLRVRVAWYKTLVLAALPFALTYAVMYTEPPMFGFTVESMIIGYYSLLLAALLLRSGPLLVLSLLLCLLSRFSLAFWVPLLLVLMFFQDSRRRAVWTAGLVGAGILLLYVIPFLSHDWGMFLRVQRAYAEVAVGEWKHLNPEGLPYHLYNGVGFANFFFKFGRGDLMARVQALRTLHLALLLLITVGSGLLYWRQRAPRTDYRVFAALVLKLYLITFYAFLQVPYAYLASVGIFASLFVVLVVAAHRPVPPAPAD